MSNYEFEKILLLNFDCTYLMDCFYCFHYLDSRRKTPVSIARFESGQETARQRSLPGERRPGPASWPAQLRLRSEAESVRQSVQPRPDPNGSLALSVAHWPRHHHRDGLIAEMITVTAACQ